MDLRNTKKNFCIGGLKLTTTEYTTTEYTTTETWFCLTNSYLTKLTKPYFIDFKTFEGIELQNQIFEKSPI